MKYSRPSATREEGGTRIEILHDGKSVSRLWIVDRHMRIGSAAVSVAGIAGVGTDRDHRMQGLALRVLRYGLRWMQQQQYDTSVLFGIENFYHRVGFATVFPEHGFAVDVRSAESARSPLRTRPMRPADLRAVRALYNRQNQASTATAVRTASWDGFPMGSGFGVPAAAFVVCARGAGDKVLGYVLYDDVANRCRIAEVAATARPYRQRSYIAPPSVPSTCGANGLPPACRQTILSLFSAGASDTATRPVTPATPAPWGASWTRRGFSQRWHPNWRCAGRPKRRSNCVFVETPAR